MVKVRIYTKGENRHSYNVLEFNGTVTILNGGVVRIDVCKGLGQQIRKVNWYLDTSQE